MAISSSTHKRVNMARNYSSMMNSWILCTFAFFTSCYLVLIYLDWNGFNSMAIVSGVLPSGNFTKGNFLLESSNPSEGSIAVKECNVFDEGRWIYDPDGSPAYKGEECPFLSEQVSCQRNGRPDSNYEKWSWEAEGCKLTRFNATNMLEMLKGKRMVIVGDSINSNQWESLACLLYTALPPSQSRVDDRSNDSKIFKSLGHNCSVEFYWSPFLIQLDKEQGSNSDGNRVLRLDKLSDSAYMWAGADIMVFNSGHWWFHDGRLIEWDFFEYNGKLVKEMEIESAFQMAMSTWAKWIDQNVNSTKTSIYFRSISPDHFGNNHECVSSKEPIKDGSFESSFPPRITDIVTDTIKTMNTRVRYLNITQMSRYRIDAHPAVYAHKEDEDSIRELESLPRFPPDCSHWCLPGLPDTWNRLLYASMVMDS